MTADQQFPETDASADDTVLSALRSANPVDATTIDAGNDAAEAMLAGVLADNQRYEAYRAPTATGAAPRRWGAMVAVAAVVALIAGAVAVFAPVGSSPALAAVQQAATNAASASSGQALTDFSVDGRAEGESGSLSGRLTVTFDGEDLMATAEVDELPEQMSEADASFLADAEMRYVDGTLYVTEDGQSWMAAETPTMVAESMLSYMDGRKVLGMVSDLTDVEEIGTETVLDAPTTHYRGLVDLSEAATSGAEWLPPMVAQADDHLDGQATIDLWVGDDDLLRRVSVVGNLAPSDVDDGSVGAEYRVTTDFVELGQDQSITVPEGSIEQFDLENIDPGDMEG